MKVFSCLVRIGSNANNEVPKTNVSVAEILILRHLHGDDAVVDIEEQKSLQGRAASERLAKERDTLRMKYGDEIVNELFGQSWKELPDELPRSISAITHGGDEDADSGEHDRADDNGMKGERASLI